MLYWETITPELTGLLRFITEQEDFKSFRLCGGTALALQLGHRISADADYVAEKEFDKEMLMRLISKKIPAVTDLFAGELGVFLKSNGIKADFLSWNISFIRQPVNAEGLILTHVEEIAAMKLFAITRRGEKKDYYDVAVLLQHYNLSQLLQFYRERHPQNDVSVVTRFLTGFADIESQPDPVRLIDFTWQDAKLLLQKSVKEYMLSQRE
jgi:hypothetical protein